MDKAQALHLFWSSFKLPAISEESAYDTVLMETLGIDFPYITYEFAATNFDGGAQMLNGSLWYRGRSWRDAEAKAKEICSFIGYGGFILRPVDGGYIRIQIPANSIAYRRVSDPDDSIRRIIITISVEFMTDT